MRRANRTNKAYDKTILLNEMNNGETNISEHLKKEFRHYDYYTALRALMREGLCKKNKKEIFLTKKGQRYLNKHIDYVKFFNFATPYINIAEYQAAKNKRSGSTFENIMMEVLLAKAFRALKAHKFALAANLYFDAAYMSEENEQPQRALFYYIISALMEIGGFRYSFVIHDLCKSKNDKKKVEQLFYGLNLPSQLCNRIYALRDFYDPRFVEATFSYLPQEFCMQQRAVLDDVLADILAGKFPVWKWNKSLKEAFQKRLQERISALQ